MTKVLQESRKHDINGIIKCKTGVKHILLKEWDDLPSALQKNRLLIYKGKPKPCGLFGLPFFNPHYLNTPDIFPFLPLRKLSRLCPDNFYFFTRWRNELLRYLCLLADVFNQIQLIRLFYAARAPPCMDVLSDIAKHPCKGAVIYV